MMVAQNTITYDLDNRIFELSVSTRGTDTDCCPVGPTLLWKEFEILLYFPRLGLHKSVIPCLHNFEIYYPRENEWK